MEISGSTSFTVPKLYHLNKQAANTSMVEGQLTGLPLDTVEISTAGRQLAADAIEHEAAKYYGTAEINDSLNQLLAGKEPQVSKAVYTLIQSNLLPDGTVSDEEERAALLEAGLSQAQYIADHYMAGDEAGKFMDTVKQIAAIAKTRTVDPATGKASYVTLPQKPQGAPDDYISADDMMKRFEPETYTKLQEAVQGGGDWGSILMGFAKRIPQHPDWTETYLKETEQLAAKLKSNTLHNRFEGVATSDMSAFTQGMRETIQRSALANPDYLIRNMEYFAHILK